MSLEYGRFRRRFNQSRAIRNGIRSRANAACLEVGDYVCLRGTVTAGARQLESPNKRVPCVAYRVVTVRVVDSRSSKKKVHRVFFYFICPLPTKKCNYLGPCRCSLFFNGQAMTKRRPGNRLDNGAYQTVSRNG